MVRHIRRNGPRPRYAWVPGDNQQQATGAASRANSVDLLLNYAIDAGRDIGPGMVIERVIGTLIVEPAAVNTLLPFMAGLMVVPEGSLAALPLVKTEITRFLWWHADECSIGADEVAVGTFIPKQSTFHFDVSSRQRMLNMGDELRLIMQNDAVDQVITWSVYTRTLLRVT